jgi:hypothetical protein
MQAHDSTKREWSPRVWEGIDFFAWLRLFAHGRGRVAPRLAYIAGIITWMSLINSTLRWLQNGLYSRAIDREDLEPPLFVLGHWRTGTTLLHELLSLDDRHTSPTTHQCLMPNHAIISESLFCERLNFLLPGKRPMDNMPFGWRRPQEDEFALMLLGEPSTYLELAFPNRTMGEHATANATPLDLSSLSPRQMRRWQRTLLRFLKMVALMDRRRTGQRRRVVLKSPPHTARIPEILAVFPEARFAFIRRNPVDVYRSTIKLWNDMAATHGLQVPQRPDLIETKVLAEYRTLMTRYEATKLLIPAGRLVEIDYEALAADMPGVMQKIYDGLNLAGWDAVRPKIEQFQSERAGYVKNRFDADPAIEAKVQAAWGELEKTAR